MKIFFFLLLLAAGCATPRKPTASTELSRCDAEAAYLAGAEGRVYERVCAGEPDDESNDENARQFAQGRETFRLKLERLRLQQELRRKTDANEDDASILRDVARLGEVFSGERETLELEQRIEDLEDKVHHRDLVALHGTSASSDINLGYLVEDRVPGFRRVTGGLVGGAVGFGLGHVVTGTYRTQGWKWTALDVGLFSGLAIASGQCTVSDERTRGARGGGSKFNDTPNCRGAVTALVSILIASRVWQVIEVAKTPSVSFEIQPETQGASAVATLRW